MSPEVERKKKESKMSLHSKEKRKKKKNKSLTDELNSTFNSELESNSKSCGHFEVVVEIRRMVVEVEMILVVVDIVVQIEQN
jgi:hypothetical protein